uniref:Uncharacterized protein n=1 Tax=Arundo donax TaxID=35708 RepID=A0A0A9A108_ARUDO
MFYDKQNELLLVTT